MTLYATVFKAELQIADMDRGYYRSHSLTIARHPSETDERMMVRVLAFALHASEGLQFTRGLCAEAEPDLREKGLTGEIDVWIEVGLPDDKRLRKASRQAERVYVYAYGGRGVSTWWERTAESVRSLENVAIIRLPAEATQALAGLTEKSMSLQCTVQEGQAWIGNGRATVFMEFEVLLNSPQTFRRP